MTMAKSTQPSQPRDMKMIIEKDVKIPLRDGAVLYADVFRPENGDETFPAIMSLGPYQKDKLWIPPDDLEEKANPYMAWETANPLWWCPRGYACVRVDARGSGKSPGKSEPNSYQEAIDYYDAIEWMAKRGWCNGNIGTLGISYHANSQWRAASLQPPSLKAIIPWEGRADLYRDQAFHGGILALGFINTWISTNMAHHLMGKPREYNPDAFNNNMLWDWMSHSLDSDFWRVRSARWEKVTVPMYSVGNWTGNGLHLRGNTEGYMLAASKNKKLRLHTGTHFHPFHSEEGRLDQLRFFDHWLKGNDTGIMEEPPVKLQIRTGGGLKDYKFRFENEWPIARTKWTKMYLKINSETQNKNGSPEGDLVTDSVEAEKKSTYAASPPTHAGTASSAPSVNAGSVGRVGISFQTPPLTEDTEVTGPIVLVFWASSSSEDMDVFATIRNIDANGKDVWEAGQQGWDEVPVAKGYLRVSHRKLDPEKSLPYRPYHAHTERHWLKPDEVVECHLEIWPSCMVFKKGHRIQLDVQSKDGVGSSVYRHYPADYNIGANNTIHAGGKHESYLLLPIIPAK
jgi:predicted acyl esterase